MRFIYCALKLSRNSRCFFHTSSRVSAKRTAKSSKMSSSLREVNGLRIAVEGCGHGTLNAIYAATQKACEARGWDGVDLLIIGGDFQAVRNASDLTVMACPVKYRQIGDFHAYYSGATKAPYLTIFVGGNHEASSHLWELFYGGWVAPNIWYMGVSNVVRLGGVRIAGMSGIWKGYNYNKPHFERLPYSQDDIRSIYHVREIDTRKLLQLRSQVDIGISHDWPRGIEKHGNQKKLFKEKPDFAAESRDGTLGSLAVKYVMDRLRPPLWFSAHLHCRFSAVKIYEDNTQEANDNLSQPTATTTSVTEDNGGSVNNNAEAVAHNEDEIDLDVDDETPPPPEAPKNVAPVPNEPESGNGTTATDEAASSTVPLDLRAQLPAAFSRPQQSNVTEQKLQSGQPTPPEITNKEVRFLSLDKCLPGRKFLQVLEVQPFDGGNKSPRPKKPTPARATPKFEYDPEWLAITRSFNDAYVFERDSETPPDQGQAQYRIRIDEERQWVEEHIVKPGKLEIPRNFVITAPPFVVGSPEIVSEGPIEYNNPQTQQFCDLLGMKNPCYATDEERQQRMDRGPPPVEERSHSTSRGRGGGRGGGRNFGGGRGRGRGGRGRGMGRGRGGRD
ncbi:lariat debranching enzyme [Clarireedia jacksonii]